MRYCKVIIIIYLFATTSSWANTIELFDKSIYSVYKNWGTKQYEIKNEIQFSNSYIANNCQEYLKNKNDGLDVDEAQHSIEAEYVICDEINYLLTSKANVYLSSEINFNYARLFYTEFNIASIRSSLRPKIFTAHKTLEQIFPKITIKKYDHLNITEKNIWNYDFRIIGVEHSKDRNNLLVDFLDEAIEGTYFKNSFIIATLQNLTISQLFENSKSNQKVTIQNINEVLKAQELNTKTLQKYNDIAYYLQSAGANEEAIFLLEKIIEKYPNRTVAYLNLGDAYNGLGNKQKAKQNYEKYIELMKKDDKETKIPKRVMEYK